MWIEVSRSYCYIHLKDKTRMIVTYPMAEIKKSYLRNNLYSHIALISLIKYLSFLDNIKDTIGKDIPPFGKQNPPLKKNIRKKNGNDVNLDNDDEDESSGKDK